MSACDLRANRFKFAPRTRRCFDFLFLGQGGLKCMKMTSFVVIRSASFAENR